MDYIGDFYKIVLALPKAFVKYCPYSIAGKKVVQVASGKNKLKEKSNPKEKEKNLIGGIKMGKYIAIVGVFCPFFWISLLTGASTEMIRFNAIHSGIVILIGLVIMLICRIGLGRIRKESSSSM